MNSETPTNFLALRDNSCGSASNTNLWYGSSLDAAGEAWRELSKDGEHEVYLTGLNAGTIAPHELMRWKYGKPGGTFACPICGQDTPHQHSAEAIARSRETQAWAQRERERQWGEVESRVAALKARSQP